MKKHRRPVPAREYAARARKLKEFGFAPAYRIALGKRNSAAAKGAITRAWKKHSYFLQLKPETQPVHFVKFKSKAQRAQVAQSLSSEAITPGGFFVQIPKGVKPSHYRVKVGPKGELIESTRGRQHDVLFRPDRKALALEGPAYLARELKARAKAEGRRVRGVRIMVGGFEGKSLKSPGEIGRYISSLRRRLVGNAKGQMTATQFSDKFQLKVIFRGDKPRRRKGRRG